MKRELMFSGKLGRITAMILLGTAATLTGCGKSGSGVGGTTGTLPPGGGGVIGNGQCVPISGPIGFQGNNIYFDSANVIGGWIPQTQAQIGQMGVGVGGGAGPYQRQAVDGTITMNVTSVQQQQGYQPYQGYPTGSTPVPPQYGGGSGYPTGVSQIANVSGTIYISQQTQADIMWRFSGGQYNGGYQQPYANPGQYPYQQPNYQQQQIPCVSGIAMNLGHYNTYLYGGRVYLYMNNTNHGYILRF